MTEKWKITHNLKAYLVYRKVKEGKDKKHLCEVLSQDKDFQNYIPLSSIKMKIKNYLYLDTGEGLSGYSQQSKDVYSKFKNYTLSAIEEEMKERLKC